MNNFEEYGFKADFEGEILGERHGFYIGWFKTPTDKIFHGFWDKETGHNQCASVGNAIYDTITPLKKEWYEDESNFPEIVTNSYGTIGLAIGFDKDKQRLLFRNERYSNICNNWVKFDTTMTVTYESKVNNGR